MPAKKWDKQRVIDAVSRRQQQGRPLNRVWRDDPSLYAAAKCQFGSWRKTLQAMEIPGARSHTRWPQERVLAGIRARQRQGVLTKTRQDDRLLYDAAGRRFGSWQQALVAAGLKTSFVRPRRWTRERIIAAIRDRHRQRLPLRGISQQKLPVYAAAQRHFGSWRHAVAAAGIEVAWPRTWSRERVIDAIQSRQQAGLSLRNVCKEDAALAKTAYKYFGGWAAAMTAAGIACPPRRQWTRERLIPAIQAWYPQGRPVGSIWQHDRALTAAAKRHFGSWHAALRAAGIEPQHTVWSAERVLLELRAWRRSDPQAGLTIENKRLAKAATAYFGSCQQALEAAGVEPRPRKWSQQCIIAAIQDLHVQGRLPKSNNGRGNQALYAAAKFHFGRWTAALTAAGLHVKQRRRRTTSELIAEIQHWQQQGLSLKAIRTEYQSLYVVASRRFGGWHNALVAAGVKETVT